MTHPADPGAAPPASGDSEAWERALREAVDWTILLDDEPDDAGLHARFERWRAQDPLHDHAWAEAAHTSNLIAQTGKITFLPEAPARSSSPVRPRFRPGRRTVLAGVAAAAVAWIAAPQILQHARADYVTGTGQQRTVTLDDGSTVRMAPGSAIAVAYSGKERHVTLVSGEAYFEVTHNPARPFEVLAGNTAVTVLGTGFDVRLGERATGVSVKHGRVRVTSTSADGRSAILEAGEWAQMPDHGPVRNGHVSAGLVGGWTGHRLTAVDRPLSEVLADLRRYHSGAILLTSRELGRKSVTGTFKTDAPAEAARLIAQPHGGTVRQITPWLIVVSAS
ncbi:FecR family protein [Novosphingobium beihaiensis]|uniref:FecR family protein n=1 Tax=Novosphingobium beihaiensis TaxID=2930389 RepID=A0ABT0BPD2_9SPHN|nr:FecR family protein [Novosphingobium beihaiensis]MCJ2186691.1 FecR family protein [Novosphingobium beihaiensis]